MRREVLFAGLPLFFVLGLLTPTVEAQSRPGTLVAITNDGVTAGTGTMLSIDSNTGAGSVIATLTAPGVSLSFSDDDGKLYGSFTIRRTLPLLAQSRLVSLDPVTGTVTEDIGVIVDSLLPTVEYIVAGMGFADDGTLYGVEARTDALVTIDTATAQATPVGGLGINILNYGGTVADGVFYLLNGNRILGVDLYTVDLLTGIATRVGPTGISNNGIGLALDGDGGLVAVINDSLYTIDRATGAATAVGNTGFTALSSLEFVDSLNALHGACPCEGSWKNHGQYVSCVSRAAKVFSLDRGELVSQAAQTTCGK